MDCCQKNAFDEMFDRRTADREMKRYRRKGPRKSTRVLVDAVRAQGALNGDALLDIGGGIGAIPFELSPERVTSVDVSAGYQETAREEAVRRGVVDRFDFIEGDCVEVAEQVASAEVVTLDRVICCYENMPELVARSAARAKKLYAVVYPRYTWWNRLTFWGGNFGLWLFRKSFRAFVHHPADVDRIVLEAGLTPRFHRDLFVWRVDVYAR